MRNFVALLGTVGTLLGLGHVGVGDPRLAVTGGALALSAGRRGDSGPAELLRAPLVALVTAGLGLVFTRSLVTGDVLFVVVFAAARMAWRLGPAAAVAGRAVLLPLVALFLAPPVALAGEPVRGVLYVLLAVVVATAWVVLLPPAPPSVRPLARVARIAVGPGPAWLRRLAADRVPAAALALDARLTDDDARLAVLAVEHAVATGGPVEAALARARRAVAAAPAAAGADDPDPADEAGTAPVEDPAAGRREAVRRSVRTRLAVQSTTAVALAFLAGQQLFGHHWPWTVLTVLTVSLRATSRGEVAVTAAERLLGAAAGTVVATLVSPALGPVPGTVGILAVLGAGLVLRPYGYAWWAAAMTAALSLLYGVLGLDDGAAVLAERLLAIAVGGLCAVLPAALLAPVRTRAAVRRRLGVGLRAVGAALRAGPTVATTRAADRELDLLHQRARPLRLTRRSSREARWAREVAGLGRGLHAVLLDGGDRAHLGAEVRTLAAEVKNG